MSSTVIRFKDIVTLFYIIMFALATPINNGLIVKFNAVSSKEEIQTKSFDAILTKNQELKPEANNIYSQAIDQRTSDTETGCTNRIAKILFPSRTYKCNDSQSRAYTDFIKIPIIEQKFSDYKIIVATAPPQFRLGRGADATPVVIYIVFPNDDSEKLPLEMPSIYFVSADGAHLHKKEKIDPLLIIDTNRTVTGLKSTEIMKFVKFKNKLTNQMNYEPLP